MGSPLGLSEARAAAGRQDNGSAVPVQATAVKAIKTKRLAQMLPWGMFALGCAWILLFPLVTVTTGEAKPRGTFFDENAMLVHHTVVELQAQDVHWVQPGPLREAYPQVTNTTSYWLDAPFKDGYYE